MLRSRRCLTFLLLIAFLAGWLPSAPAIAQAPSGSEISSATDTPPPAPKVHKVAPLVDAHLPSLALQIQIAPDPLAVGGTAAISLTITNQAPDPATDLVITLPVPAEARALPGPATLAPNKGWRWTLPRLAGRASTTLTAQARLDRMPAGQALLLKGQVTARELPRPIDVMGGTLVLPSDRRPARANFTPGAAGELRSRNGQVAVRLPAAAHARPLALRHTSLADKRPELVARGEPIPSQIVGFKRGLDIFFLDATDNSGTDIHEFAAPLTLSVGYTPEQLQARGISEADLALFWFNPASRTWDQLTTTVDPDTHTATATVDHFSAFALSDGASPSEAFIPSLQGFQVGLFSGAASYSYPIEVPAGPGGLKPTVELSYSSAATDGPTGMRVKQQASWVGKGWSLDTGSISRNKIKVSGSTTVEYFTLVFNGQSFDLMRGPALVSSPSQSRPSDWIWYPTNESFIRVRAVGNGDSTATRGGFHFGLAYPRYTWQVWTKDGTLYEFSEDAWWGFEDCSEEGDYAYMEAYKWMLTRVIDTHQNTINYTYGRESQTRNPTCFHVEGTTDADVWPETITWGGNIGTSAPDRYKVTFVSDERGSGAANDMVWDGADNQYGGINAQPHETRRLEAIQVSSMVTSTWQLIRQYNLDNEHFDLYPDAPLCTANCNTITPTFSPNTAYPKLALHGITEVGQDGLTSVPTTTLTYGPVGGQRVPLVADTGASTDYPTGSANRLIRVENGQGGRIDFTYDTVGATLDNSLFYNYHRVISKTVRDGTSNGGCSGATTATTCTWTYSYGTPNMNTIGTSLTPPDDWPDSNGGKYGTQAYPNSAALYYNAYFNPLADNRNWLSHKLLKEFRGHNYVLEIAPNGAQTEHWFHQGEAVDPAGTYTQCTPSATGGSITSDTCFQHLRDGEFLKGREKQTCMRTGPLSAAPSTPCNPAAAGGQLLTETKHTFQVDFYDYSTTPLSGLWRAFTYESQTEARTYDPANSAMPPMVKTTQYFYDPAYQFDATAAITTTASGIQYGNLTRMDEYLGPITPGAKPHRVAEHFFTSRVDATTYIVDREWATTVRDGLPGEGRLLAMSHNFYDATGTNSNNTTVQMLGTKGELTRASSYLFDLLGPVSAQGQTLSGRDTVYTYDAYGNRVTETTYAAPSTRLFNGITWSISQAGGASPSPRTTTTTHDSVFHVFPTQMTYPTVNGVTLVEYADYDYRMGTLIKTVGFQGNPAAVDCRAASFSIAASESTICAQYDVFGRLIRLIKPGNSTSAPAALMYYYDYELPFRYLVETFTGTGDKLRVQQFYDGVGKQIQVKTESVDDLQNNVKDTVYDALGKVVKQSQARYVTENQPATVPTSSYWDYTPWASDTVMRWTTTTYDALSRPLVSIAPDGTATGIRIEHHYGVVTGTLTLATATGVVTKSAPLAYDDVVDPNRHRTQTRTDAFGRLVETHEVDGDCASYWGYTCTGATTEQWHPYSRTYYGYNGADQLTDVFDAQNNHSQIAYDSLGRKINMIDPDMGAWSYQYDISGNLVQQTDAKNQVLWFGYDARNRLVEKRQNNASGTLLASYSYDESMLLADGQPRYGLGQRTSMTTGSATTRWRYDARGRKLREEYTVTGLTGTRAFQWTYDSADRITTITYPSGEVLSHSYDAASHPTSICSSLSGNPCYASGAQYNALGKPAQLTFGNSLIQRWQYSNPAERLDTLQIGTSSAPGTVLDRRYTYDSVGNILTLQDAMIGQTQYFSYDHRDRLRFSGTSPVPSGMAFVSQQTHAMAERGRGAGLAAPLRLETDFLPAPQPIGPLNWHQFDADPALAFETTTSGQDHDLAAPAKPTPPVTGMVPAGATPQTSTPDVDRLPLSFFPNGGQTDKKVRFQAQTVGGALFFTPDAVTLTLPSGAAQHKLKDNAADATKKDKPGTDVLTSTVVRVRFEGTNGAAEIRGDDPQPGVVNFLNGTDRTKWKANLPTYAGLMYRDLYPGIDLHYTGNAGELKGTYQVAAGADPARISWRYQGAKYVQIDEVTGDLLITLPGGTLREQAPIAWQDINGQRVPVTVGYALADNRNISFVVGNYDRTHVLTIDPTLVFGTFIGGSTNGLENGRSITVDSSGNIYLTGDTDSADFPTTAGAYDTSHNPYPDVFVTKFTSSGSLAYSTFLGGSGDIMYPEN